MVWKKIVVNQNSNDCIAAAAAPKQSIRTAKRISKQTSSHGLCDMRILRRNKIIVHSLCVCEMWVRECIWIYLLAVSHTGNKLVNQSITLATQFYSMLFSSLFGAAGNIDLMSNCLCAYFSRFSWVEWNYLWKSVLPNRTIGCWFANNTRNCVSKFVHKFSTLSKARKFLHSAPKITLTMAHVWNIWHT